MKSLCHVILSAILISTILVQAVPPQPAHSQAPRFVVLINQNSFVPDDILVLYGKVLPNDSLIVRILDPEGKTVRLDAISSDENGSLTAQVFRWPQPSRNFVFGLYTIEVNSSIIPTDSKTFTVEFGQFGQLTRPSGQATSSLLVVKLDSPTQISVNRTFRIFVQVTFDGALVDVNDPAELLSSSHIHPENATINLSDRFVKLHVGIYYADVRLDQEGTYIIHAIAFHRGLLAHDSKVITASSASLGTVQEAVNLLDTKLDTTQTELNQTNRVLNETRTDLLHDVERVTQAVDELQLASGQINSIILPILVLIAIVIALQISLFARIRASFK
jgi:hypothetical protein